MHLNNTTNTEAECDTAVHKAVSVDPRTASLGICPASVEMLIPSFILSINDAWEECRDEAYQCGVDIQRSD